MLESVKTERERESVIVYDAGNFNGFSREASAYWTVSPPLAWRLYSFHFWKDEKLDLYTKDITSKRNGMCRIKIPIWIIPFSVSIER